MRYAQHENTRSGDLTPLIMDDILSMISSPHSQGGGVYESDYPSFLCVFLDRNGQKTKWRDYLPMERLAWPKRKSMEIQTFQNL